MFDQIKDVSLRAVASLLAFFYDLPVVGGNYGLAIILLTLTVMVVLMPLTMRATKSQISMMALQPELKALQKKYADDKPQLQQEMMALYSRHGVNPVGGCLPMVAQLPVFLILFNVLRGLTRRVEEVPYFVLTQRAQELAGSPVDGVGGSFDPNYINHDTKLYQDLITADEMGFGPFNLAAQPNEVISDGVLTALPYVLLILFVVGTSYFQQHQITTRRGAVPDNPTPQQQTQQQLMKILPLMSGIWSFLFPTGLVLYWATSNVFRIGQQYYISRAFYGEDGEGTQAMKAREGDDDVVVESKPKKSGDKASASDSKKADTKKADSKSSSAGSDTNGTGKAGNRDAEWAEMRARRSKVKARKKQTGDTTSSRVTPKGTKPSASKKKKR